MTAPRLQLAQPPAASASGREFQELARLLLVIESSRDLAPACAAASRALRERLGASECRLVLQDGQTGAKTSIDEAGLETPLAAEADGPVERGLLAQGIAIEAGPVASRRDLVLWAEPPFAVVAVPMRPAGAPRGALLVAFHSAPDLDAAATGLLHAFGTALGLALERAELTRAAEREQRRADAFQARTFEDEESAASRMALIAHEVKRPLTAVKSYAEALLQSFSDPGAPRDLYLGIINDECDRLGGLVGGIFDLSRLEAGRRPLRLTRFMIARLVEETLGALAPVLQSRQLRVEAELAWDLEIEADPDLLRRMLSCLLQYSVECSPRESRVSVHCAAAGAEWVGFVEDHGPRVADGDMPRLFDSSFRGRGSESAESDAPGLGLAIARGVVEAHGGRMWAESPATSGLRIRFALPLRQVAPPAARRVARELLAPAGAAELHQDLVEKVSQGLDAEMVSLATVDPELGDLVIAASRGLDVSLAGRRTPLRSGIAGSVAAWGRPVLVRNIETDRRFERISHPQYATKSLLSAPLWARGEVIGVINATSKRNGDAFDEGDLARLSELCEGIATALEHHALSTQSGGAGHGLDAQAGPAERAIPLARSLAAALGMDAAGAMRVVHAARLRFGAPASEHRNGGYPGERPGLAGQNTPATAIEILASPAYFERLADALAGVHERWDGAGHPEGLRGEAIPIEARILAALEAWIERTGPSAARSNGGDALSAMRREAGGRFDPHVVLALERALEREGSR
jgi:signal transduction histidine kinase/putative methionine-R-sulfoxide reductase with GAF domain